MFSMKIGGNNYRMHLPLQSYQITKGSDKGRWHKLSKPTNKRSHLQKATIHSRMRRAPGLGLPPRHHDAKHPSLTYYTAPVPPRSTTAFRKSCKEHDGDPR